LSAHQWIGDLRFPKIGHSAAAICSYRQGLRTLSFGPQDLTPPALRGHPGALLDNLVIIREHGTIGAHAPPSCVTTIAVIPASRGECASGNAGRIKDAIAPKPRG
jgi:hypothetical protein